MKQFTTAAIVVLIGCLFTIPAFALENIFKGYFHTRAFTNQNFDGNKKSELVNLTGVDCRTRLYYTAIINDDLKLVNAFEINAIFGNTSAEAGGGVYKASGAIGTDEVGILVKYSYAEFNVGPVMGKVGLQDIMLGRGFLFGDDFAGAVLGFGGDTFTVPFIWIKGYEGGLGFNKMDVDFLGLAPSFKVTDKISISPYFLYSYSKSLYSWSPYIYNGFIQTPKAGVPTSPSDTDISTIFPTITKSLAPGETAGLSKTNLYYIGIDVDAVFTPVSLWFTGIYETGKADVAKTADGGNTWQELNTSVDFKAWLAAAGVSVNFSAFDIHGQAFYATGNDQNNTGSDFKAFFVPCPSLGTTQSYYWAEIMGYGLIDYQSSYRSPGDHISNILAGNLGVTIKPLTDLTVTLDAWYARLAKGINVDLSANTVDMKKYLGTEFDLRITYQLFKNLSIDVIGAYLFAGDATTLKVNTDGTLIDKANPWEAGVQISLSY